MFLSKVDLRKLDGGTE